MITTIFGILGLVAMGYVLGTYKFVNRKVASLAAGVCELVVAVFLLIDGASLVSIIAPAVIGVAWLALVFYPDKVKETVEKTKEKVQEITKTEDKE